MSRRGQKCYLNLSECQQVFARFPDAVITCADGLRWFARSIMQTMGFDTNLIHSRAMDAMRKHGIIQFGERQPHHATWIRKEVSR